MSRLPRKAVVLFALVGLIVGACSSSATTAAPGGPAVPAGASSAAGSSAGSAVNPSDPSSIITQAISGGTAVKSFHLSVALSGTINAAFLKSTGDASLSAITSDLKLDGTSIEGDVDIANSAAHLALSVPALPMMGNVPISADVILAGGSLYYKASLLGPKYTKADLSSLSSLAGGMPVAVPTPGSSPLAGMQDQIAQLRQQLDAAGAKATLVGVEQIGGKDAYHINVSVPLDLLNSQIAAAAAAASPPVSVKIDSASVDFWVYKDTYLPAKFELKGASSAIGSIDLVVTVSNYDQPVTIAAPPASDVSAPSS
ncbi:MAG: hypothetical protein ACXWNI_01900 [Candidatus Limnocylindrales bacterium]